MLDDDSLAHIPIEILLESFVFLSGWTALQQERRSILISEALLQETRFLCPIDPGRQLNFLTQFPDGSLCCKKAFDYVLLGAAVLEITYACRGWRIDPI